MAPRYKSLHHFQVQDVRHLWISKLISLQRILINVNVRVNVHVLVSEPVLHRPTRRVIQSNEGAVDGVLQQRQGRGVERRSDVEGGGGAGVVAGVDGGKGVQDLTCHGTEGVVVDLHLGLNIILLIIVFLFVQG